MAAALVACGGGKASGPDIAKESSAASEVPEEEPLSLPLTESLVDWETWQPKEPVPATLSAAARADIAADAASRLPACTRPEILAEQGDPVFAAALCPGDDEGHDDVILFVVRGDDAIAFAATDGTTEYHAMDGQLSVLDREVCVMVGVESAGTERMYDVLLCAERPQL